MVVKSYESKSTIDRLKELEKTGYKTHNSCDGCKHFGKYENELEYGYNCPCIRCKRRCSDNYESK